MFNLFLILDIQTEVGVMSASCHHSAMMKCAYSRCLQCWASWPAPFWSAQPPPRWSVSCTCWAWCSVSVTPCWASLFWPGATASEVIRAFPPTAHSTVQTRKPCIKPCSSRWQIASLTSPLPSRGTHRWRYPPASEASFSVSLFVPKELTCRCGNAPIFYDLLDLNSHRHAVRCGFGMPGADD